MFQGRRQRHLRTVIRTATVLAVLMSLVTWVPGLLLFLALGMVVGTDGLGWIDLSDYELARRVGVIALAAISVPHYLTPISSAFTDTGGEIITGGLVVALTGETANGTDRGKLDFPHAIAAGIVEHLRNRCDRVWRWIICHEMLHQLGGNETGCGVMPSEKRQRLLCFLNAPLRV